MFSEEEKELVLRIRELRPFQKMEIKLMNNEGGKIVVTTTSTERLEMYKGVL